MTTKSLAAILAACLFATSALGQVTTGTSSGGGGSPGGTSGQIQYNNGGSFGGAASSDVTVSSGTAQVNSFDNGLPIAQAWFPAYQSGWWYVPPYVTAAASSTLSATRMGCGPFMLLRSITVTALGVRINTAGTTSIALAVYANSGGYASGAPLISTAAIADTATGNVSGAVTATTLTPGIYWDCEQSNDSTVAIQAMSASFSTQSGVTGASTQNELASNTNALNEALYYTVTFGTWPTLSGSTGVTWQNGVTYAPMIQMEEQ